MNTPRENEQVSNAPKQERLGDTGMEDALSAEFDRLAAESEDETTGEEEEEEERHEREPETDEPEQIQAEAESAEESGYKEPAPERWPDDLKNYYNKLDPQGRELLMEKIYKPMQRTYTESTQQISQARKAIEPMLETMKQYRGDFEKSGANPVELFRTQMAWAAHFARVGPEQGIHDMREAYGMSETGTNGQGAEQYLTPMERQMKAELAGIKQQLGQTSQQFQSQQEQQAQTQQAEYINGVRSELQSFINEQKDGKPAHPHVEKVAPAIAGIIRGGLVQSTDEYGQPVPIKAQMKQAYELACRMDPSIRTARSTGRQVTKVKNVQDADVVANNPAGQSDVPHLTVSQQLEEEYDKLAGRR